MKCDISTRLSRRKAVWGPRKTLAALAIAVLAFGADAAAATGQHSRSGKPNTNAKDYKLDGELTKRASRPLIAFSKTPVIVELAPGAPVPGAFVAYARRNGRLDIINGAVLDLPNYLLTSLANSPGVLRVHYDRPAEKANYRTAMTIGSRAVSNSLGFTGAGIGVAVVDSGVASWHDDLTNRSSALYPYGNQRVSAFVDFVNGQTLPYDDDGHGTHVAGVIAGNGADSSGKQAGVAPDASLVVLKALDANGNGTISTIIQALGWALANRQQYNIRVVNLSVGAAIHESYFTDPLTIAARRLVDAGVVVVAAAGNNGRNALGETQYGGIGAPGNAPWVLTVGASSSMGTIARADDRMATFSSRGPTYFDWAAKPDLVAPGVGIVSLAAPGSNFYYSKAAQLSSGSVATAALPYLSLSGTSMAAPAVAGTVALMLQANPALTPNAVKAILQYTSQEYAGYDALTEGAGFLNAVGAVRLAHFYATASAGARLPSSDMWSKTIIWGNHQVSGGFLNPSASAFQLGTSWGVAKTDRGDNIVWGTMCGDCDNIVWGTYGGDNIVWGTSGDGDNIVWGTGSDDNIVWGTDCGGADCDNIVWGTYGGDNIVWGTASRGDNIVWGTAGLDGDNIVWGTSGGDDNIVWGTAGGDNIVWGTGDDNIVWGTDDNIVWGTVNGHAVLWDVTMNGPASWITLRRSFTHLTDEHIFTVIVGIAARGGF